MAALATIRVRALRSLIPPPRLQLSEWIEANICLPEGTSALPGRVRLWPYQREIADAISDQEIERGTMAASCSLRWSSTLELAWVLTAELRGNHAHRDQKSY